MLRDFDAERMTFLRVADAGVTACANEPGCAGGHRVASLVEREHRDLEALTRPAHHILFGNFDAVHDEIPGVAGENAPFFLQWPARKSFEPALDDKRADAGRIALLFLFGIGPREHQEVVGDVGERNPGLFAVEDVPIAFLHGRRLDRARVAAGAGFGQAVPGQLVAFRLRDEIAPLLVVAAPREQRQAVEADVHRHDDAQRRVDVFELLAREAERDVVHAGAAVLLRHADAEQPELLQPADDALAVEVVAPVVIFDVRLNFARAPLTHRLLEQAMFVGEVEADHAGLRNRISRWLFLRRNESETRRPEKSLMMSRLRSTDCRPRSAGYARARRFTPSSATMNLL